MICTISFGQISKNNTVKDNSKVVKDTVKIDTIIPVKEKLEFIVDRESEDERHDLKKRKSYFMRNARVTYGDMTINADYIELDWNSGDVYAEGKKDSIGQIIEQTKLVQGMQEFFQDAFKVNFKTKIGTAYNVKLSEGEGVIVADRIKRINDSVLLLNRADYTTDTYFKDGKTKEPDYVLRTSPGKMLTKGDKKTLITGPINIRIYDIPTPLIAPFSFIPLGNKRSGGILMPRPGERADLGFFVENIGFYAPIGEYFDLKLTADIYTKGSWGIRSESTYKKNYKYSGGFSMNFENRVRGIKGLTTGRDAYSKTNLYGITWRHQQDPKSNPYTQFNANVNFTSSRYYQNSISTQYLQNNQVYNNNINSSITLNKKFRDSPFTATLSMNHSQNLNPNVLNNAANKNITLTLPQLNVNMMRIYPFAPKAGAKKGIIQNLGVDYTLQAANQIRTNDDNFLKKEMWKEDARLGASHRVNLSSAVTLMNYFPLSLTSTYNESWSDNRLQKTYNPINNKVEDRTLKGFSAYRTFNITASLSTNIYGTFLNKNKEAKLQGIRHVISPLIGYTFNPNFQDPSWGYYKSYVGANNEEIWYNQFQNALYGIAIPQLSNSLNFSLLNNLEIKVKDDNDPTGTKKIKIFESLRLSTNYNFSADSFKLSPIAMTGTTSLFDKKVNIQFGGQFNPYKVELNENNQKVLVDKLGAPRLTAFQFGTGYSMDNSTFGGKKFDAKNYTRKGSVRDENFYYDNNGYAHFAIPWSLNATIAYTYNNPINSKETHTGSILLNGKIKPTPFWDIGVNANYDFIANEITMINFAFERDLRSFKLSFNWNPIGRYKYYSFFIGIKATILSDLKYNERSRRTF